MHAAAREAVAAAAAAADVAVDVDASVQPGTTQPSEYTFVIAQMRPSKASHHLLPVPQQRASRSEIEAEIAIDPETGTTLYLNLPIAPVFVRPRIASAPQKSTAHHRHPPLV